MTGRLARRFGIGPTFIAGCFLFPAPLILVPGRRRAALVHHGPPVHRRVPFGRRADAADILAGTISAAVIPPPLRTRVSGAFMVVNYGVRPLGTTLGGILGTTLGVRPTLWIATVGALGGLLFLLPSPIRTMRELPEEAAP